MSKFFKTYLPAISMAFTFIILYASITNILAGYTKEWFCYFILEIFAYLILSIVIDWLTSVIDFSKYIYHFAVKTIEILPAL